MIRLSALALAALPMTAEALSCMQPDPVRTFLTAQSAPDTYRILIGTLAFDQTLMPQSVSPLVQPNQPQKVTAQFTGGALGANGPVSIADQTITLVPECAGPWCGNLAPGGPFLMFVRDSDTGPELTLDPCQTLVFDRPNRQVLEALETCLVGGPCDPAPLRR